MAMFGRLYVPDELLGHKYALDLLAKYFQRDAGEYVYSGAAFDTYPVGPASAIGSRGDTANTVTDSDLVALSMLGIRITGHEALVITQHQAQEIGNLLRRISADARIDDEESAALLVRGGPAWTLWELLYQIKDRTKEARFGAVAAGKLLARKRPGLIPIEDSLIASVFRRKARAASSSGSATSRLILTVVPWSVCGLRLDASGASSDTLKRAPSTASSATILPSG